MASENSPHLVRESYQQGGQGRLLIVIPYLDQKALVDLTSKSQEIPYTVNVLYYSSVTKKNLAVSSGFLGLQKILFC